MSSLDYFQIYLMFMVGAIYAQCPLNIPNSLDISWPPSISQNTELIDNILYLEITIPIVQNRSDYSISFPYDYCNYPTNNNWIITTSNCNMIFTLNETWTKYGFVEQSISYYTLNIKMSYVEKVVDFNIFDRYINNEINMNMYLQNIISVSTNIGVTPVINTYTNIDHITKQIDFTSQQTIYVSLDNIPSFAYLQIIVNNKYLFLNETITEWGLYNNLIMDGNSFQFDATVGNNEYDLFFENGDYTIQVLIMTYSRRTENIANTETIVNIHSVPSSSKDKSNNVLGYYSILVFFGAIIITLSSLIIHKRIKQGDLKFIYPN